MHAFPGATLRVGAVTTTTHRSKTNVYPKGKPRQT
jgi:hypothetical protein